MPRVQTVLGDVDPADLGWVLPHEHTAIALWHIPDRWDYWELRRDEPVIVEELAAFRAAGGRDDRRPDPHGRRPRSGLARRPGPRDGPPGRDGLRLVPRRLLPGGGARSTAAGSTPWPTRSSATRPTGVGGDRHPGRDHRRDRDGQALAVAPRRSGSIGPPPGPPAGPAWRSRPTRSSPTSGSPSSRMFEAEGADLARVVIGHADSYPSWTTTWRSSGAARPSSSTSSAWPSRRSSAMARAGSSTSSASCWPAATSSGSSCPGRLPRQPAPPLRRQRLHLPRRHVPAAAPRRRRVGRRDPDDHRRQPAAAADDRLAAAAGTAGAPAPDPGSGLERRLHADLDVALERPRDRAAVLGLVRGLREALLGRARDDGRAP